MRSLAPLSLVASLLFGCARAPGEVRAPTVARPANARATLPCDGRAAEDVAVAAAADEATARALLARGTTSGMRRVIAGYERALDACPKDPGHPVWLAQLAGLYRDLSDREGEARALRALVCENRYPYAARGSLEAPRDDRFEDPYVDCAPARGVPADPGARVRSVQGWLRIGDQHQSAVAPADDGFEARRAVYAYLHAVAIAPEERSIEARAKLALALYSQGRFAASFRVCATLLDDVERGALSLPAKERDGDPESAQVMLAACTLRAAGALASVDFDGPPPDMRAVAAPDPFAHAQSREDMGRVLRVAIDRAADPKLLPEGKAWSAAIALELARLFCDLDLFDRSLEAYDLLDRRFPDHANRPRALFEALQIVEAARDEAASSRIRRTLRSVVASGSAWRRARASDREALAQADQYVRE